MKFDNLKLFEKLLEIVRHAQMSACRVHVATYGEMIHSIAPTQQIPFSEVMENGDQMHITQHYSWPL
jgi:hypothetical protein